jgi:Flp pilus assembly protein TadG
MIEFAMAMPFLIFLLVGIFEVTRIIHINSVMRESAGDVARMWSRLENQAEEHGAIEDIAKAVLAANRVDLAGCGVVALEEDESAGIDLAGRKRKMVEVRYTFSPVAPVKIMNYEVFNPGFTITAVARYPNEVLF